MTTARGWSAGAELHGELYVCCGDANQHGYLDTVEKFAMVSNDQIAAEANRRM